MPPVKKKAASKKKPAATTGKRPSRKTDPNAELKFVIDSAWERRAMLTPDEIEGSTRPLVERAIDGLESGEFRVAEPDGSGGWTVNEWLKKAVLLYFRINEMELVEAYPAPFWDKVEARFGAFEEADFRKLGVRVVPGAIARRGSYFGRDVVLMPSFVNIGAHVGEGTMVDTWATVGSCAQIGADVHLSGGVGIGGVLEPPGARPVIVEDGAFIGSRCIVVEGVHVGARAVLGANVVLTSSTHIIDVTGEEPVYHTAKVPPESVVIPGMAPKRFAAGQYGVPCALIIGRRKPSTDLKTSLNETLREFALSV
jgi:2,3,4,5-tetrahydropyridine-2-carboxylate N-succinyltransferase